MSKVEHYRPSFWQRLLSCFFELTIQHAGSPFNPDLCVSFYHSRFRLHSRNATYSYEDKYYTFLKAFDRLDIKNEQVKTVLVLGFGLGSVPAILEKVFHKNCHYTGVEIDPVIIELYWKYGFVLPADNLKLYQADAFDFVKTHKELFDLIAMDVFRDTEVPLAFESLDFLENAKRLLKPNGMLLFNRLGFTDSLRQKSLSFFHHNFKKVFPHASAIDLGGNIMLVGNG